MWKNNLNVRFVYTTHGSQLVWAYFSGMTGWKLVKQGAADGVANLAELLSTAKANGRKVNVFLQGNNIERAVML